MISQKWEQMHSQLERQGNFDEFTVPFDIDKSIEIDGNYEFLPKNILKRFSAWVMSALLKILAPIVNFFYFGATVKGKGNYKQIKNYGVITVSNHIHHLDCVLLRQALNFKDLYVTGALHNNKKGLIGMFIRKAGFLPLSPNPSAQKNFYKAVETLVQKKSAVQFYAERSMWLNYPKPRPMKKGAFYYAVKFNCPILPIYFCPKPSQGIRKKLRLNKIDIYILPPIFPDPMLDIPQRILKMRQAAACSYLAEYRKAYKVVDNNIYDIDMSLYNKLNEETKIMLDCQSYMQSNKKPNAMQ